MLKIALDPWSGNTSGQQSKKNCLAWPLTQPGSTVSHRTFTRTGHNHDQKNRGAEQGDAAAPAETGSVLGIMAQEARWNIIEQQATGTLPWADSAESNAPDPQTAFIANKAAAHAWDARAPAARLQHGAEEAQPSHPKNDILQRGGVVDVRYLGDGTAIVHPRLGVAYLKPSTVKPSTGSWKRLGASATEQKTTAILHASAEQVCTHDDKWQLEELRGLCAVHTPEDALPSGPQAQTRLFEHKAAVVAAMRKRVQEINDSAVEQVLSKVCLGVSKTTHILRIHGHNLAEQRAAVQNFDSEQDSMLRHLFPGQDEEATRQASLGVGVGGLGHRRAEDAVLPASVAS